MKKKKDEGSQGEQFHRGVPPTTLLSGPGAAFKVIGKGKAWTPPTGTTGVLYSSTVGLTSRFPQLLLTPWVGFLSSPRRQCSPMFSARAIQFNTVARYAQSPPVSTMELFLLNY